MPTSGAMYHWACRLGGKGWGWFTAWFNIIGQLATLAGIDYGCALFVTPLVGVPTTTGNVLIVYAAVLAVARASSITSASGWWRGSTTSASPSTSSA